MSMLKITTPCRCGMPASQIEVGRITEQNHQRCPSQGWEAFAAQCTHCGIIGTLIWADSRSLGHDRAVRAWNRYYIGGKAEWIFEKEFHLPTARRIVRDVRANATNAEGSGESNIALKIAGWIERESERIGSVNNDVAIKES